MHEFFSVQEQNLACPGRYATTVSSEFGFRVDMCDNEGNAVELKCISNRACNIENINRIVNGTYHLTPRGVV